MRVCVCVCVPKFGREWVTRSIPLLVLVGLALYVDRIVRREVVLDSSALCCTIFMAHVLNVCRSNIAHVDSTLPGISTPGFRVMESQAGISHSMGFSARNNSIWVPTQQPFSAQDPPFFSGWQENMVYLSYAVVSMMLLADLDLVSLILPSSMPSSTGIMVAPLHTSLAQHKDCEGGRNHRRQSRARQHTPSFMQLACWHQVF